MEEVLSRLIVAGFETARLALAGAFLGVVTLTGACAPAAVSPGQTGDDEFRARLAAGCDRQQACDALYTEADARYRDCMKPVPPYVGFGQNGGRDCTGEMQDKNTAIKMQEERRRADQRESAQARQTQATARGQALEQDIRARKEERERQSRVSTEQMELRELMAKVVLWQPSALETLSDGDLDTVPDQAKNTLQRMSIVEQDIGQSVPEATKEPIQDLDEILRFVAKEKACRAEKKCMADRAAKRAEEEFRTAVVSPMCEAEQSIVAASNAMARERANPSGYVDKVLLHDAGATIQAAHEQLAAMGPAYMKVRHHPWRGWSTECH